MIESDGALAFMDQRPAAPGHVLVIPKAPVTSILDATDEQLADVMALARCVAIAQSRAFKADGLTGIALRQNNGAPNQHVGHFHLHLVPQYATPATIGRSGDDPRRAAACGRPHPGVSAATGCPSVKT